RSTRCSSWVEKPLFFLLYQRVCTRMSSQEHSMKEHGHWTPGLCPGATEHGAMVSSSVPSMPPLLRLQRALPWAALCEVLPRRWAAAGQHTEGRPGVPGDVSLYVPGVVLLCVQHLHAREMAASLAEHGVARGCLGRQGEARPQMRDHSNRARAYAALGQAGGTRARRCASRSPRTWAVPLSVSLHPIPRRRRCPWGIPTNLGADGVSPRAVAAP